MIYEFPDGFFKQSAILYFFVLFYFKSKYLQSTVEFLTKINDVYIIDAVANLG